ncbi:hypothetical protein B0T21DRAFT_407751 [Apiosordaria backusii]|uniref:Uncharacterized protein n=1 Tax=Apiosordaria backusii TaxID=314023 RepID=A0AA40ESG2_9PEZI|nr:hypothetical protein B0T21DRAFT_407751 [Apiosordaria backusii]
MFSIVTLIPSLLVLSGLVHAAPPVLGQALDDVDDFTIVDLSWDLPINPNNPDGAKSTVTGTIEQAIAKMEAAYPGWNATFRATLPADINATRTALDDVEIDCKIKTDMANILAIKWGIHYLRGVTGKAKNGPGPKNCGRVSCSWDSAIYWCNEDTISKELDWEQIADGAQTVLDNCAGVMKVKGQVSYKKDKWSTVVRFPKGSEGNC